MARQLAFDFEGAPFVEIGVDPIAGWKKGDPLPAGYKLMKGMLGMALPYRSAGLGELLAEDHVDPASAMDSAMVHAYVADILPKGVPTYIRQVRSFVRKRNGFVADIVVFDGGILRMEVSGPLGAGHYTARCLDDDPPFHWNDRRRRWERVPEPV